VSGPQPLRLTWTRPGPAAQAFVAHVPGLKLVVEPCVAEGDPQVTHWRAAMWQSDLQRVIGQEFDTPELAMVDAEDRARQIMRLRLQMAEAGLTALSPRDLGTRSTRRLSVEIDRKTKDKFDHMIATHSRPTHPDPLWDLYKAFTKGEADVPYEGHCIAQVTWAVVWAVGKTPDGAIDAFCRARFNKTCEHVGKNLGDDESWAFKFVCDGTNLAMGIRVPGGAIMTWWGSA